MLGYSLEGLNYYTDIQWIPGEILEIEEPNYTYEIFNLICEDSESFMFDWCEDESVKGQVFQFVSAEIK